jgi:hypothetical protein
MTLKNQKGFSHLLMIPIILVLAGIGFAAYRVVNNDSSTDDTAKKITSEDSEPDIVLQNIGIDNIDNIDINDYAVREFDTHGLKGFYVFGDSLSGGRLNPTFEFASLKAGTKAVSAIDGVVTFIKEQVETSDFEVSSQRTDRPGRSATTTWLILRSPRAKPLKPATSWANRQCRITG